MRRLAAFTVGLGVLLGGGTAAVAQPATPGPGQPVGADAPRDPYDDAPAAPAAGDPEVDDAVAEALLGRARVLTGEGAHADAKQLVVEAVVRSPQGPSAAAARALLAELNARLGISDAPPPSPPPDFAPVEVAPPPVERDVPWTPAPAPRTTGFVKYAGGIVAGAIAGGLFADVVTGLGGTTPGDVFGGMVLGGLGGGLAAHVLGAPELTAGDHALIDSMAAWGLVGGLTLGLAIDPPEGEAYSLNGVLGIGGGYLVGHVAARRTDITPRRMVRVNGLALVGAAAPWILYGLSSDDSTSADEQTFGFLSAAGLVAGVYLGFRWTRGMTGDPGTADAAPAALFQRGRTGWTTGGVGLTRAQGGTGAAVTMLSGTW